MSAVLAGIDEAGGFDARECGGFVGTSAGSIVATALAGGVAPASRLGSSPAPPAVDADAGPSGVSRAIGAAAMLGGVAAAPLASLALRSAQRPGAMIRRAALAGEPGAPQASVAQAVQASCPIPGVFRPVPIDGRTYVDGGAWSPTNIDGATAGSGQRVLCLNATGRARTHGESRPRQRRRDGRRPDVAQRAVEGDRRGARPGAPPGPARRVGARRPAARLNGCDGGTSRPTGRGGRFNEGDSGSARQEGVNRHEDPASHPQHHRRRRDAAVQGDRSSPGRRGVDREGRGPSPPLSLLRGWGWSGTSREPSSGPPKRMRVPAAQRATSERSCTRSVTPAVGLPLREWSRS